METAELLAEKDLRVNHFEVVSSDLDVPAMNGTD